MCETIRMNNFPTFIVETCAVLHLNMVYLCVLPVPSIFDVLEARLELFTYYAMVTKQCSSLLLQNPKKLVI